MDIISASKSYLADTYNRFNIALVKGKGARAWDENGKEYIDLGSGIAVNVFGYGD
ncbi:MAG: aminotransferase class III-fold pyridoxal phosphate-dependent enzyme, partial [Clostridia bacterium]|nr:aminotransferase class III-fold pyridoxal phosphate-dependent enzyme [Clostridia bacterium]